MRSLGCVARGMLLWAIAAGMAGCGPPPDERDPPHGILLVSLDTLRADYLGTYGYTRFPTSPRLDAFAREAYVFDNCIVTEPWTLTSHMSLVTGLHPHAHGVREDTPLAPGIPTLAQLLRERGYRTTAFVDGGYVRRRWGFDRGFDEFTEVQLRGLERLAPAAIDWLDAHGEQPFFLFLHTYDVHSQGRVPWYSKSGGRGRFSSGSGSPLEVATVQEFTRRYAGREGRLTEADIEYLRATYADGVRFTDDQLSRVLDHLEATGLDERTLVIVWSDHGDALFDHGDHWSHGLVTDNTIRVPLLVRIPGWPGGRRVGSVVSAIDLAPTILDLVGAEPPESMQGRSLVPLLSGDDGDALAFSSRTKGPGERLFSARSRRHHLIWDGSADAWSFYDVVADPGERRDLHPSGTPEEAALRARLEAFIAERDGTAESDAAPIESDGEVEEELRALGYVE